MRKHFFRRKEEKMKISTKTIVTVGMFTAVLAVLSILQIPMPTGVPITLQTFAMALCGYVLGWQSGVAATLLYIVLGTVGVPIFAGMSAGPGVLFGYTGGFIFGFIFLTLWHFCPQKKSGGKDHPWSNRSFDLSSAWCCSVCSFGAYYYWSIFSGSVTALYCKRCDFSGWCLSGCHCCP